MSSDIWQELKDRQAAVESALRASLGEVCRSAPGMLVEAMAYSLFAGGKRLRPILVLLACEAAGGTPDQALPGACAVEMVHTYSLIHDDLPAMDDDDLRRGLPTCHKKYGEATAILAGDALLTAAFQVLAEGCPARTAAVSCSELARGAGAVGMVGGQILDLAYESSASTRAITTETIQELENVHRRKTGALFRSALRLGLYAAQAESGIHPRTQELLDNYADAFGLAFQVTDDLLDVESSAVIAGKGVGKDAARGKLTYPGLLGVAESRRRAVELGRQAVEAARCLGSELLERLAAFVVDRQH